MTYDKAKRESVLEHLSKLIAELSNPELDKLFAPDPARIDAELSELAVKLVDLLGTETAPKQHLEMTPKANRGSYLPC